MWAWLVPLLLRAAPVATDRLRAALALEQGGNDAAAVVALKDIVKGDPRWDLTRLELGRLELKVGRDLDDAQLNLDIVRSLAPENPRGQYLWGLLMEERGRPHEAVQALELAVTLREDYDDARFRLASLYLAGNDLLHAEQHYRWLAKARPDWIQARIQFAQVLEREGRINDGEQELRRLLTEHRTSPVVIRKLADFYERTGRPEMAAKVRQGLTPVAEKRRLRDLKQSRR